MRRGYDAIAERYAQWRVDENPAHDLVADLDARLPDGSDVLELGCGNGRPGAVALARRHNYTGVDISPEQLARARALVPRATFVEADYTTLDVRAESLDAVAAILTLTHIPRGEHAALLSRVYSWLRPGGWVLLSMGASDLPDEVEDWLGAPMFFSHFDADVNRELVRAAGFILVRDDVLTMIEDGHGATSFLWILARRPQ